MPNRRFGQFNKLPASPKAPSKPRTGSGGKVKMGGMNVAKVGKTNPMPTLGVKKVKVYNRSQGV